MNNQRLRVSAGGRAVRSLVPVLLLALWVFPGFVLPSMADGLRFFGVIKGRHHLQTNAGPVVAAGPSNHVFQAILDFPGDDLTNVSLALPGGAPVSLQDSEEPSGEEYRRSFADQTALDAAFPNGVYTLVLSLASAGPVTNALALTGNAYPGAPLLSNLSAAQAIDPATAFTLTWNAIAGGTSNDFVQIQIKDCRGEPVLETPGPGQPGTLTGVDTSFQIPARRLRPGMKYRLELLVARFVTFNTNSLPGAAGIAAYFESTQADLGTTGTPVDCPPGHFELMFQYPFYQLGTSTQGVVSFPQTLSFYVANFSMDAREDTNFPATVAFTGPGGFGWVNGTNTSGHVDPVFAWYGSPFVSIPAFPPGGLYTVHYKGTNLVYNLLDPAAAGRQVLFVPTAIVRADGMLEEIRWTRHDTNGTQVAAQSYMRSVIVRVEATGGFSYDAMNHGIDIPPTDTSHALAVEVPWSTVTRIQLGFRDDTGNLFVSAWEREAGGSLGISTAELPEGTVAQAYQATLQAGGGQAPYAWSIQAGQLPAGLELNPDTGEISGTPTSPGFQEFVVRVQDSAAGVATRQLVLSVAQGGPQIGTEPNLRELLLIKGQSFTQTNAAGAVPAGPSNLMFRASVSVNGPTSITNGWLRRPSGTLDPFERDDHGDEAFIEAQFASVSALDAAYPAGAYAFLLATAQGPTLTNHLTLPAAAYPATPRISNFTAAQAVNPTNDFTLTWDALAGAVTNDVILFEVRDCQDREVFRTPGPGEPGALSGTATGVLIPGRTLRPGQVYSVNLMVGRVLSAGPTSLGSGTAMAGYLKQVMLRLVTVGAPAGCPVGDLRLVFTFRPGTFSGNAGSTAFPQDLAFYTAHFSLPNAGPPPANVTFTGPAGSGLNGSGAGASGGDGRGSWVSSINVPTPPYPPGGLYSVFYGDVSYAHVLLDPNAAARRVLVIPTLVTNGAGEVTSVQWRLRDANGSPVAPQAYMRALRVRLAGPNGPIVSGDGEFHIPPTATNVVIDPPVALAGIARLQTGFEDVAGHEFLCDWLRGSAGLQITSLALPGGVISNAYSRTLTAFGGTPPYSWSITSGDLPPGLELDADTGTISGTPAELGRFEFTARVRDSGSAADERGFALHISPPGPDVAAYVVAKGRRFQQTNSAPPGAASPGFQFVSFVEAGTPGGVEGATLQLPGGLIRTLTNDFDRFNLEEQFASQSALDAAFANGAYTFVITTVNDGAPSAPLILTNNAYPVPPRVANWPAAQGIDAARSFTLSWDAFAGGTTNDLIVLGVATESGEEIYGTPGFLEPNYLNGTRTSAVIPGGVLEPGARHKARLLFVRRTFLDTNSYPGVPGIAAYFAETEFELQTANPAGQIQFAVPALAVREDVGTAVVTVNRVGGTEGTVSVDYAIAGGSATAEEDFFPHTGTLEFTNGVTSRTIAISIENDDALEGPETIGVTLSNPEGGAGLGPVGEMTLTILDDDVSEGPNVDFYVAAKGQSYFQAGPGAPLPGGEQAFFFGSFARTAFPGALTAASIAGPGGTTNVLEGEEDLRHFQFFAGFTNKAALDLAFNRGVYTFRLDTVTDGSPTPAITLPADAYPVVPRLTNWAAAQGINAFADFALAWDAFTGGTADDFVQVTIQDTNTFETVFSSPDLLDDGALNGTSTGVVIPAGTLVPGRGYDVELLFFNVVVINSLGYPGAKGLGGYARQTRTMVATATPPPPGGQVQFAEASFEVSETNGTATVSLIRIGGSVGDISVLVAATNGTATAGADFVGTNSIVEFADGVTNATFTVPILDDSTFEGPEAVKLVIRALVGEAALAGQTNAALVIVDNELPPTPGTLQFSVASVASPEAAATVTLTVTRTGGSAGEVTVEYETADDTAASGDDYFGDAGTLVFAPGVVSQTITLDLIPDDLDETNEKFTVTLSNPSNGAALGDRATVTVGLVDDDAAGVLALSLAEYRAGENGDEALITVRRTGGTASGVAVDYVAEPGTADEDVDFEATMGTLEFGAGEVEKTISIPLYNDELPEGNETFTLALSNPAGGATLGRITNAVVTIVDDEVVLQFARAQYTNSESGPAAILTVVRTGPTTEAVTVDFATEDATAFAGEDYTATTGTLSLAAGATSRTITVPILNDGLVEEDESFTVTLSNPAGAQLGPVDTATVEITDNDFGGTIALSAATFAARENSPVAILTVVRSGGRAAGVTVDFSVADGSATDGEDYTATNGTLTFAEGETRLTIAVPITDDALDEDTETFTVSLANATGGALLGEISSATVGIADNDVAGTLRLSATTYTVSETGAVATITVLRSGGKAGGVTVDYATEDITATAGDDYTATVGTLTFAANETAKTFQVPILADGVPDGNKTLRVLLGNPGGGGRLVNPTNATVTILDDVTSVQFASATYSVGEAGRAIVLTVVRTGPPGTVTVNYSTADGTAANPADYRAKSGVVTFTGTATTKTITIPIVNDTGSESDETFTLTLTNPSSGAQLGDRSTATVTIVDNDPASRLSQRRVAGTRR